MSDKATFAAGCFWGVEDILMNTPGVLSTSVGYIGGHYPNPDYQSVCTGATGHAEAVELAFDPAVISYEQLLNIFFRLHDPTTKNRQGPDIGTQYRSAIFYHSDEQKQQAEDTIAKLNAAGKFKSPIVTEVVAASEYYAAEDYHQQYFQKKGFGGCHVLRPE
jgi:peptide-methionine (S)-S-oxide reductase